MKTFATKFCCKIFFADPYAKTSFAVVLSRKQHLMVVTKYMYSISL